MSREEEKAEESGVPAHVVAKALGHESPATTHAQYTQPATVQSAVQRRVLQVLDRRTVVVLVIEENGERYRPVPFPARSPDRQLRETSGADRDRTGGL